MFDFFNDVAEKAKAGNAKAKEVMQSWADAEWFTSRPEVEKKITVTVFKVPGETNTDDLSPAPDATTRPDIPMHYLAMLKNTRPDAAFKPEEDGKRGPMQFIEDLKAKGNLVAYVGDVVGTGSRRKSATNSVVWATGQDIPLRAQQALRRRDAGRQDRPHLLQHARRLRRACRSKWTCPSWKWATWLT